MAELVERVEPVQLHHIHQQQEVPVLVERMVGQAVVLGLLQQDLQCLVGQV
jgi:hypothetical protein